MERASCNNLPFGVGNDAFGCPEIELPIANLQFPLFSLIHGAHPPPSAGHALHLRCAEAAVAASDVFRFQF